MTEKLACPKCNSDRMVPRVRVKAGGAEGPDVFDITAVIHENPEAIVFRYAHHRALHARICGNCGYTELYVENPGELYETYKKTQA